MASQRTLSRLLSLHSWAGIVTGLLLFVVCFSGAVVVFKNEIDLWANPQLAKLPRAAQPLSLDTLAASVQAAYRGAEIDYLVLPDAVNPAHFAFLRLPGRPAQERLKVAVRSDSGAVVGPVESELGQFLRMLHVFLFFGPRWIVGFLGVAMLVLIATGFVLHRKVLAELFTQRWDRSLRVLLSDMHKLLGIWGLAFHLLIAFTGAWLGLSPVVQGAAALWQNDAAPRVRAPATAATAAMQPLDALRRAAEQAIPGLEPTAVVLQRWGRSDARALVRGGLQGHLASTAQVALDGASGRVVKVVDPRHAGVLQTIDGLMEPLHFGGFGGLLLKWLYFVLGLTPAVLSLSGTLIWIDRQAQRPAAASSLAAAVRG